MLRMPASVGAACSSRSASNTTGRPYASYSVMRGCRLRSARDGSAGATETARRRLRWRDAARRPSSWRRRRSPPAEQSRRPKTSPSSLETHVPHREFVKSAGGGAGRRKVHLGAGGGADVSHPRNARGAVTVGHPPRADAIVGRRNRKGDRAVVDVGGGGGRGEAAGVVGRAAVEAAGADHRVLVRARDAGGRRRTARHRPAAPDAVD